MLHRSSRLLLAAILAIVGWEWIVSGINKVLSGTFPNSLADILTRGVQNNPNAWYVSFLQAIVIPQHIFFGYAIEWTEVTIGIVFLSCALLLSQPRKRGEPQHNLIVGFFALGAIAAIIGAFLCINFHFWMGRGVIPGIGAAPSDEGIDLDALIPPFSLVILIANLAYIKALRGDTWYSRMYKSAVMGLRHFIGIEDAPESKTAA